MKTNTESQKLIVYFDGACHLCSREVDIYRKKDLAQKLRLVDISSPDFDPSAEGIEGSNFNKYFHARDKSGELLVGLNAFNAIWKELGIFKPLSFLADNMITKPILLLGYNLFAEIRPYLPKKNCHDGNCKI